MPKVVQLPSEPVGLEFVASGCPPVSAGLVCGTHHEFFKNGLLLHVIGSAERRVGFRGFTLAGKLWCSRVGGETVALKPTLRCASVLNKAGSVRMEY